MTVTHRVEITYLMDTPPRRLVFDLQDVGQGGDKMPEVLRSIARSIERDQEKQKHHGVEQEAHAYVDVVKAKVAAGEKPPLPDLALGDPSRPRYFHLATGIVAHCNGRTVQSRDRAKARLAKQVVQAGGNPDEIEYRAGLGPGLRGRR